MFSAFAGALAALAATVVGFNLEPRLAIVKTAPSGEAGSHFGFSVALHRSLAGPGREESSLLVGAPTDGVGGSLFRCPVTGRPDDCRRVPVGRDVRRAYGDLSGGGRNLLSKASNDSADQWLGAVVRSKGAGKHQNVHFSLP